MSTSALSALPIRRLTPHDLRACADLSEDRGWPREEHKWSLLLAAGTGFGIDDPQGGLVAACVLTCYGPLQAAGLGAAGLGAVGMMLVAERHARQGVGLRLLRHVLDAAGGTPLTLYATPNGRPLYEKLGFKEIGRAETLRGHFAPPEAPGVPETATTTRPAVAGDLSTILRLDHEVFGVDRTHMITRLPAFADQLRVAETEGRISGYAAAWPNTHTEVIGPLIAQDVPTATALITSLAAGTERRLRVDVDVRHEELLRWMKEHGFATGSLNTVMAYGDLEPSGDRTQNFAPLTVATG